MKCLLYLVVAALAARPLAAEEPRPIKILFLGDNGHHQPAARFRQVQPVLLGCGIDLTYTDRAEALNPKTLTGYDGLKAREAKIPAESRLRANDAAERIVRLYEAWGKPDQAAVWKRKLGLADLPVDVFARP